MPPAPKEHGSSRKEFCFPNKSGASVLDGERIVISGISGLYPEANNIQEFTDMLYNKVNPVNTDGSRWTYKHPELPEYLGKLPGADRFDAQFFTVHYRLGHCMDPMSRKMLEQTYQAIYDAGLSPAHLYGKKIAVFTGSSFSDSEKYQMYSSISKFGLGIMGASKTMNANRISYWLNAKGPSLSIDVNDCSSTTALEAAYLAVKSGECEAAIVGGAQLFYNPHRLIHHGRVGVTSKDGRTKSFAENSEGYAISDAITVFLLQKAKDALRVYAEIVHVKNEYISLSRTETGPKFGYVREPQLTADFIKKFYEEAEIAPQDVEYVEAYGTGVAEADKSELDGIEKAYCKGRVEPLLVGSVTSNIGLTEAASGMAGITKILLGYHKGELAATVNCEHPRKDIAALQDGRIRIVNKHQSFGRKYAAFNGTSVGGVSAHVLLDGHYKPKDLSRYKSSIPHLVILSGRQETSVQKIFDDLKSRVVDAEELALLNNIHSRNISGHLGRGYIVLDTDVNNNTVSMCEKAEYFDDAKRPLWFVYSGMGSQWPEMGTQLMQVPIFASAIERCDRVLKPKGLDIVKIITSDDPATFDNILHSFVGIAAVQIGLTDILRELGLKPDGIIGHSVGELGCAYADGCMTAEEMILASYSRGLVSLQTKLIHGSMAAVGLGYDQISTMCPPEIDVACRNSAQSSTISGPADIMKDFVAELTAKGIFAKEVQCSNIAYHSRYIADAGPQLLKYLQKVITDPKPRNERWISTSVPRDKWDEPLARYCSAEYHTNNLLSPVLFEETLRLIPSNAVLVEVAPHGLLQAILKRALPVSCLHVPLTRRGHRDNIIFLLQAIGEIYMAGYPLTLQNLYPKVQFPVSTGTPMLSHLVEWIHSEHWALSKFVSCDRETTASCTFITSIHDDEHSYLRGHIVREKMCYPFAAALIAVWDTFAMYTGVPKRDGSIMFHDLHLYAEPVLFDQRVLRLNVAVNRGTGLFEVMSESSRVMTGYISDNNKPCLELTKPYTADLDNTGMKLTSDDIYQLLSDRNYSYSGDFRCIEGASSSLNEADIIWNNNWVTLIDGMLQLNALRQSHDAVSQAIHIRNIFIDVAEHVKHIATVNGKSVMKAAVFDIDKFTRCGGVLIEDIKFKNYAPIRHDQLLKLYVPPPELNSTNKIKAQQDFKIIKNELLQCAIIGKLDSLHWVESPYFEESNLMVKVYFAGLNALDVKRAIGISSYDSNSFGMDYSGTTKRGERVMGIIKGGSASTYVCAQPELLWPVPKHWSLEDAATVPFAYAHAFYALKIKGGLTPGMSVLVNGGVGALGQAVIAIALAHNCQVFTTVSNMRKKQFLRKLFPQLKDEHIGNSRDVFFSDGVLLATKGKGCELAICCARGEFKNLSLACLGLNGILIDTVQIQDCEDFKYGMYFMTKQRSYMRIDFSSVFTNGLHGEMKALQKMLTEGISAGYVVPLSRVTYAQHEAPRAFRLLGASRHRGRVLLRMCENSAEVEQRLICDPHKCQVMFWDNDPIGVHLANRLVDRGARKLYICCKNISTYLRIKIRSWQSLGIQVEVVEDLNDNKQEKILNDASKLGVIEGIYVLVTKADNKKAIDNLTMKLNNLDIKTRSLCHQLRYFAVVSSVKFSGQQICLSRSKSGFLATYLDVSNLKDEEINAGDVADVMERALCSPHVILLVRSRNSQPSLLLEHIAATADIRIPKNIDHDVTLKQLGVDDEKALAVSSVLNHMFNISVNERLIPLLTLDKINELQQSLNEIKPTNVKGLETFFSCTGTDELLATADIVVLPTHFRDVISIQNDFEIDETYLCIVPGMEGLHERFYVLCERLKLPALVLQPGFDHPYETAQETAQRYAEILMKKTNLRDKFYILGYETGVTVAIELAAILENYGHTGTVYCLGFAPDELQAELQEQLSYLSSPELLQDAVLRHMFKLTTGEDTTALDKTMRGIATWEEKAEAYVRFTRGRRDYSAQYVRAFLEAALARVQQSWRYNPPACTIRSQLVLLRAATSRPQKQTSLQRYSKQPVIVHQLRSLFSHVLEDMESPSLINRYLDADTRAVFDKRNLCNSCRINASTDSR